MCCYDPDRIAQDLDRAVTALKGYRDVCLEDKSWWDTWSVPDDKAAYLYLFLKRPQDIYKVHPLKPLT